MYLEMDLSEANEYRDKYEKLIKTKDIKELEYLFIALCKLGDTRKINVAQKYKENSSETNIKIIEDIFKEAKINKADALIIGSYLAYYLFFPQNMSPLHYAMIEDFLNNQEKYNYDEKTKRKIIANAYSVGKEQIDVKGQLFAYEARRILERYKNELLPEEKHFLNLFK